jgi:N-acetylmuramoyl-L-alanine amidase
VKLTSKYFLFLRCTIVVFSLFVTSAMTAQDARFVIVIDAGHGGHDPGAMGDISKEKDINLSIALELGTIIEHNFKDVRVVFTRKTDEYLTLQERADIVNNNHADLFICVHTNSTKGTSAYGAESFTLGLAKSKANLDVAMRENSVILLEDNYKTKYKGFDPASVDSYIMFEFMQDKYIDKSVEIASTIQKQFADYCHRSDRGVRQAGFWVLHRSACPSVLVEVGFISNPSEERYLNSAQGRHDMATAIYNAVVLYKRDHDKRSGKRVSANSPKVEVAPKPVAETPKPVTPSAKGSEQNTPDQNSTSNQTKATEDQQSESATPAANQSATTTVVPKNQNGTKIDEVSKPQSIKANAVASNVKPESKTSKPAAEKSTTNSLSNVMKEVAESTKLESNQNSKSSAKGASTNDANVSKQNLAYIPKDYDASKSGKSGSANKPKVVINKSRVNEVRPDSENDSQVPVKDSAAHTIKVLESGLKQNDTNHVSNEMDSQLPVFKVQILASNKALKLTSAEFKGQKGIDEFEEGAWHKYTVGAEKDHSKINKLRSSLIEKFPKAFVIAFYKGKKISEAEALKIKK